MNIIYKIQDDILSMLWWWFNGIVIIITILIIIITWLRKGNFKRETESFQIVAQNNAIRTNHTKSRIDQTQQNSKCSPCGDWDETIYHIISECSKLAPKECKTRHNWVGKVIHLEMCKNFKFDQMAYSQLWICPKKWRT